MIDGQLDIYDQLDDEVGGQPMAALNSEAHEWLTYMEITPQEWAQHHFQEDEWGGDSCGCPDDRCIGHHHLPSEPCACFRKLLREFLDERAERTEREF